VTHPTGQDKDKTVMWRGKGKEDSSSQIESSSVMCDIMSTLKKLSNSLAKAQL
jgi:hypothetical protein